MDLQELTDKINETFLAPQDIGFEDLYIEDWIFIEDNRDEYLIYAIIPYKTIDSMEKDVTTFSPILNQLIPIKELTKNIDLHSLGQPGYGNIDIDEKNILMRLEEENIQVIDFNSREAYNFLLSIMKLDLNQKPSKITIER